MRITQLAHSLVGLLVFLRDPEHRDQRGLSQSAENAILLAGAVAIAIAIIAAVRAYVLGRLPG